MKNHKNFKMESRKAWFLNNLSIKSLILTTLILAGIITPIQAQEAQYSKPSLWLGAAAGANFNFYRGSTQNISSNVTSQVAFHDGNGIGLYVAPLIEFYRPDSRWGVMLQAGYDGRGGKFDQVFSPCNCPRDLSTNLSYITIEPSLRLAPIKSNFYLFAGPRFAFNFDKSFTYIQGTNPEYPEQVAPAEIKGNMSNVNNTLISMQIGAGYDVFLTKEKKRTQVIFSPFIAFQPYFGQNPRSTETWNITTIRAGASLKIGNGRLLPVSEKVAEKDTMFNNLDRRVTKNANDIKFNTDNNDRQDNEIDSLKRLYSVLNARKATVEVGDVYEFHNVYFYTDQYDLNTEATIELYELANLMKENTALKIEISGYADERGSDEYNQRLSERRSKAVVDYLVSKGVNRDKLVIYNFGEQKPVDAASTPQAWQANRRVEFKVLER